jgi:PAS domain S-box-containing protein
VLGAVGLAAVTAVCFQLGFNLAAAALTYVLLLAIVSLLGSYGASVVLAIAAAACLNYFFAPPLFQLRVDYREDALAVAAFVTTSLIVTALTTRVRKSAEASRAAHRALIDTIPALVWTSHGDGSGNFHNQRWADFTGLSVAEASGDGWQAAVHPDDLGRVLENWRTARATGEPLAHEYRMRTAAGDYRRVSVRAAPLRDEKGAVLKWYGVSTDVEDQRRAMEALRASQDQLQRSQAELARVSRVTSLGVLTAAIAHEVNQPLTAIVANAQAALNWLNAPTPRLEEVRQSLAGVLKNGRRAGDVIGGIRDLISKARPRIERLDINDAIREVLELARGEAAEHGVLVRTELADGLPPVQGDRAQLQQVMFNLVANALEEMGGVSERSRELVVCTHRTETGEVCVTVKDFGPPLDPAKLGRMFDAFYTTKPGGMGMGLSICRSIIEEHGGRLWAEPNEPQGAILKFSLPPAGETTAALSTPAKFRLQEDEPGVAAGGSSENLPTR